jgi:hypothetical protein
MLLIWRTFLPLSLLVMTLLLGLKPRQHVFQLLGKRPPRHLSRVSEHTNAQNKDEHSKTNDRQPSGPARVWCSKQPNKYSQSENQPKVRPDTNK